MGSSPDTMDRLWQSLGLDSLPPDAGSAENLGGTRVPDWDEVTLRHVTVASVPTEERVDLARLTLKPPAGQVPAPERDLMVTGLLGEGGMGKVLLAHQNSLDRDVAVKVPRENATKGTIAALISESLITGGLEHPGVIPVYSMASDAHGQPALVMKRVDGVSWSMLLRNREDPAWARIATPGTDRIETHVELLRQVCNAIAFAHRKGVLHRDIKPSNVLIGEFGEVYVADWGIAIRKLSAGERRKPSLVGSPVYLAPEMVTGDDAQMDERTDVFLLGSTLYELLTGNPPWRGIDLRSVLEDAWQCKPRPFPTATTPPELAQICLKAMSPEKEDRYASALEFREALSGFLRHRGSVRLARAAEERLQTLLATLQSTSKENVYPLLSECRFGFTQALREWPENAAAKAGLTRCIEAMAQYEISQGNLAAVRSLLSELTHPPAELVAAADELEKSAAESKRRHERLEHLSQEMDPKVASRQRALVFVTTVLATGFSALIPPSEFERFGTWNLTVRMCFPIGILAIAVFLGRRSILSTRLNRRLIGMVAVAGLMVLVQRVLAGAMGFSNRETLLHNFVMVLAVSITGGITLHWGFFWSAGAMVLGLTTAILIPGYESPLFNLSTAGALIFSVLSWRGWRGEFSLRR